jgi:hypothetical protein
MTISALYQKILVMLAPNSCVWSLVSRPRDQQDGTIRVLIPEAALNSIAGIVFVSNLRRVLNDWL